MAKPYPALVEWADSQSPAESGIWVSRENISFKPYRFKTVGYVIKENDEAVTLASSIEQKKPSPLSGVVCIPKIAITRFVKMVVQQPADICEEAVPFKVPGPDGHGKENV